MNTDNTEIHSSFFTLDVITTLLKLKFAIKWIIIIF